MELDINVEELEHVKLIDMAPTLMNGLSFSDKCIADVSVEELELMNTNFELFQQMNYSAKNENIQKELDIIYTLIRFEVKRRNIVDTLLNELTGTNNI
jgi:hypothetical protein